MSGTATEFDAAALPGSDPRAVGGRWLGRGAAVVAVTLGVIFVAAGTLPSALPAYWAGVLTAVGGLTIVAALVLGSVVLPRLGQAARRRQKTLARELVESAGAAAAVTTADGRLIAANDSFRVLARDGAIGARGPLALLHNDPESAARMTRELAGFYPRRARGERARGEKPGGERAAEAEFRHPDGRILRLLARPAPGATGDVAWYIDDSVLGAGMTRAATNGLVALAGCLDRSPIGLFTTDGAGLLRYANATFADWLDYERRALCGGAIALARLFPESDPAVQVLGAPAGEGDGPPVVPAQLLTRTGGQVRAEITRAKFQSTDSEDIDLFLVFRQPEPEQDWRRLSERATQRFARFFDHAPLGMVLIGSRGQIVEGNASFRDLVSVADDEEIGRPIVSFVHADDRAEVEARVARTGRGEQPSVASEIRLIGSPERTVQLYASAIEESEARRRVILYMVDTTEQKSLELQFAQSQKMQAVGQLAGGVAHDFNNLLTAIIGFCDLLLMRHRSGDPSFADIMQVKQNANRAANLVRQLLAFSRQQTLRTKVLVVTDVLAEISNLLRRLIGENIEFKMIHGRDLGAVKVDQGQLEQVIINLAVNARDAMPDGGTLTIRTANVSEEEARQYDYSLMRPSRYILIEVSDTGIGIPPEVAGKIFEPFYTTKEVGQGTGLGLSTVYGIIKQTGGFIFVDSEPGQGATFRIFLPVHRMAAAEDTPQAEEEAKTAAQDLTGKGTILLVEDEDAVRIFAARALRNKGYTVLEAHGGEAALEYVNNHDGAIDLLISDVVMPEMDGPSLVHHACARRPNMKVIFISGYTEDAFREKVDREQISFLPKPFSLKQLARTVKGVLQG